PRSPPSLLSALTTLVTRLGPNPDVVLVSNAAAHITPSSILTLSPSELEAAFRVSASHAHTDPREPSKPIPQGGATGGGAGMPLFLVVLDREPDPAFGGVSVVGAAAQTVGRLFAMALPEECGVLVGLPVVDGGVGDLGSGPDGSGVCPDELVQRLLRPAVF
ncbi:hypothetical protein BO71DRAFT_436594, partial [Aspergillus ellipticus CBS 707.79]